MADYDEEFLDEESSDETEEEQLLRKQSEVVLSSARQKTVTFLVDRLMLACDTMSGHPLRPYQIPFARRIFESLIISDGARLTALFSRQSGKTECVANVIATAMIFLPLLAKAYPKLLEKFAEGVWVGAFAPVDEQADNLFGRIVARLASDDAEKLLKDPEINGKITGRGRSVYVRFLDSDAPLQDGRGHSLVRKTTCHPKAKIEGRTYHIILIDEAQEADNRTVKKSVSPMGASTRATHIWTGTSTYEKNVFYDQIQKNKRAILRRGQVRQNHFQADWKEVAKCVPLYRDAVYDEMDSMGSDSDEFRLSYNLEWLLDKGQFTTAEKFAELGDKTVQKLEMDWFHSPVVVGIDCGRKIDKTIVTVVWVDWDHPDNLGYYEHRVINWLDLEGLEWEAQYFKIFEFLQHYNIQAIGVDTGGIGDVVMGRLQTLMPHLNFIPCGDSPKEQSDRFKYLQILMQRHKMIWPMGAKVRRLKVFRRFRQEMEDAELEYKGPNIVVAAPNERDAHDDYPDSLCNAVSLTRPDTPNGKDQETVVYGNFLFKAKGKRYR
jgi:terminase large subunit-like protein